MNDYEIGDLSYDRETGELTQFLVFWQDGRPETKIASAENMLLFDPEDEMPFDGGLHEFVSGEQVLKLSEEPLVLVSQTANEYSYIIQHGSTTIETTPEDADRVLRGIYEAVANENLSKIEDVFRDILSKQVRRSVVNTLRKTFDQHDRIEVVANGWLVDGYYLVDWNAKMYLRDNDPDEGDYVRSGGGAVKKDTSYEFISFSRTGIDRDTEPPDITIDGESVQLTEREMLFLAKVRWLLNRRHYHPDMAFWYYVDQFAEVDWETGEPIEDDDEPNLDQFDI